jgi:predicted nucleic acid-binding protein
VTVLLDPSIVLAAADRADLNHLAAAAWFAGTAEPLALVAPALAECDHLLTRALGRQAADALLAAIESGAIDLLAPTRADVARARTLRTAAADARVSLSDAITVAMAERLSARRVASVDRHPYSVLRSVGMVAFDLEP